MTEVSSTRLYLGNLPKNVTKDDIENHFKGMAGDITEIKLMNGFGFIEYKDPMDARDVVPAFHGTDFMGERLTVQFARGTRNRDNGASSGDRPPPRPRRTQHRMQVEGLPKEASWQDLKDFSRKAAVNVVYSEVSREFPGKGFVEFDTDKNLHAAVAKLNQTPWLPTSEFIVTCIPDPQPDVPINPPPPRDFRTRSRSPSRYRRGPSSHYPGLGPHPLHGYPHFDYDRRGPPPRGYSPRRDGYREPYRDRSPLRRDYYDDRRSGYRSPPRRAPPMDDYIRRPYDDLYRRDYTLPPFSDMYGRPPIYDRASRDYPPRDGGYIPREDYPPHDYDRGRYW